MKKTRLCLMLAVLAAMLWSCGNRTQELTNAIPQSAVMVFHFDSKTLFQKADYNPVNNPFIKERIDQIKNQGNEKQKKLADDFLKNPNSATGIDLLGDCFMYMDGQTVGFLWKMNDAKKFKQLLTEQLDMPANILKEEDGISYVNMGYGAPGVGWTKDKLLVVQNTNYFNRVDMGELVKKQLTQKADSSINANQSFGKFVQDKKDISLFYAYDNMAKMYVNMMSDLINMGMYDDDNAAELAQNVTQVFEKVMEEFKGTNTGTFISFEKGGIEATSNYYFNSPQEQKRVTALFDQLTGELTGEQIKYFAGKPLLLLSFAVKGNGMYDYINNIGVIEMLNKLGKTEQLDSLGINLQSLISNLNGDITFAFNNVNETPSSIGNYEYQKTVPEFSVFADLKDPQSTLNLIVAKIGENLNFVKIDDNTYSFKKYDADAFLGIKGGTLYVTNSKTVYDNITSGTVVNNDFASKGKGKTVFIFGNLSPLQNLSTWSELDPQGLALAKKGFDLLGDYYFTSDKNLSGNGKFEITDSSRNSLAIIVAYLDSLFTYAAQNF